ncbi:MAG: hypothetical protein IT447_16955, partial [Phycisphaerales bacterium]|nr:hypothetical protein [Phycisphaerales bacterium]
QESCNFPILTVKDTELEGGQKLGGLWSAARECYQSDAGVEVTGLGVDIKAAEVNDLEGCTMQKFIEHHKENYLVLTNLVNPEIIGISNTRLQDTIRKADIYYRVIAKTCEEGCPNLVRDYAKIKSNGYARQGTVIKSLDVQYKPAGFLPVFNFSLYKTSSGN